MKSCLDCTKRLPLAAFSRNARKKDGLDSYCKVCTGVRSAAHYKKNAQRRVKQNAAWLKNNPGKNAAYSKKWRLANPDAQRASERRWYETNRETVLEKDRLAREADLEGYRLRERESYWRNVVARQIRNRAWREANPATVAAYAAERRAAKAQRTPPWLNDGHRAEIVKIYETARALSASTGVPHHVDHEVPLRGKKVSGLHVPWNLQCLPGWANLLKSNRTV